ncbi:MAG: 30S ribosomal protein S12 methylthiotransferase RimO [Planctomycetota bacterium]
MSETRKVSLISLGCPKNLVDSEGMVSDLLSNEIEMVVDPADADLVVVNTCGFLGSAREESLGAIREAIALKERGVRAVVVTGCMVGHYEKEIRAEAPGVDRLVDFADYARIAQIADELLPAREAGASFVRPGRRVQARLTPAHFAYLKISEGCNHTCSFCVIPRIRGRMRSVPREELVDRARRLVALGARELNVVAQDSTQYGIDLYGRRRLADLLRGLETIEDLRWIRLLYAYPTEVDDDLLEVLAGDGATLPYIDVPIQHVSDRMLTAMRRQSTEAQVEDLMIRLRRRVPDLVIRTTLIVGFPGETEEDVEKILDFVSRHRIDRLGVFPYSPEEGSPAASLEDAIPDEVKQDRIDRIMTRQREISRARNEALVGREIEVLVEDPGENGGEARGRTWMDAPEIDGGVRIEGPSPAPGRIVRARVTAAEAYDLVVRPIETPEADRR